MRARGIVALAGAGTLVALAAGPAQAAEPVSQASASALTVTVAGQPIGTGEFTMTHDGVKAEAAGTNRPALSLLQPQYAVQSGELSQDATAAPDGTSEACAGVVGQGGVVQVGPENTCITDADTRARLSLGTLDVLNLKKGLTEVLGEDLPLSAVEQLGSVELQLEANALLARCTADSTRAVGGTSIADAQLYAIANGKKVKLADIAHDSLNVRLDDLLSGLQGLPAPLSKTVDQLLSILPTEELPTDALLTIKTNEQVREADGQLSVTALHVEALPGSGLLDVKVGQTSCGPNAGAADGGEPTPTASPTVTPTDGADEDVSGDGGADNGVPTEVPAGLASMPEEDGLGLMGYGIGGAGLVGLAGLGAALLLRQRRLQAERSE